jgi:hypothetical protein
VGSKEQELLFKQKETILKVGLEKELVLFLIKDLGVNLQQQL